MSHCSECLKIMGNEHIGGCILNLDCLKTMKQKECLFLSRFFFFKSILPKNKLKNLLVELESNPIQLNSI